MGPRGKQEGRAVNQEQARSVSDGERPCSVHVTENTEAAQDAAEFSGIVGIFTPCYIPRGGRSGKKEGAAQMQAGICVGRARWAAEAL